MMLDIASAPPTPADQAGSYRAARARLMRGRAVAAIPPPEPKPAPVPVPDGPRWSTPYVVQSGWVGCLRRLLAEVAHDRGVRADTIVGPWRNVHYVAARQEFCYRAMMETEASLAAIGRVIGGRHHATIIWAAARYARKHGLQTPRGSGSVMFVRERRAG